MRHQLFPIEAIVSVSLALILAGCGKQDQSQDSTGGSLSFANPEDAVKALGAAAEKGDAVELARLFGPGTESLLSSGDDVADRKAREAFRSRLQAKHQLVAGGPDDLMLQVGEDDWPMPIPLVKENGKWHFDGVAGADKLVRQRIGANELRTIDVMHGYVAAQQEYASKGHDGSPAGLYAQRLRSDAGKHNGLYWETHEGEPESPAGPFLASATAEGYGAGQGGSAPYHGYLYRPLMAQGSAATGGARNYIVNGKLTKGFAAIAYPADYGASGIMTFIVNQDGIVWQRDLGDDTAAEVSRIQQFNPDSDWTPLPSEE
jgi:hypothetical protein